MRIIRLLAACVVVVLALVWPRTAQAQMPGCEKQSVLLGARTEEGPPGGSTLKVVFEHGMDVTCNDIRLTADTAEFESHKAQTKYLWLTINGNTSHLHAKGNVVFIQQGSRIQADELDFNLQTKTGTFYVATGTITLEQDTRATGVAAKKLDRSLFGNQEPDAYFRGSTIEKLGPRTYKITHGAFTTCVQPTPRWEMVMGSETITIQAHAIMHDVVLRVKDVPVLYIPALYLPLKGGGRATGFLMPSYGESDTRGFTLSNAFFWAINRSEDATFYHDWYSKLGQGFGGDYEYISDPQSRGDAHAYVVNEKALFNPDGTVLAPAETEYVLRGSLAQNLTKYIHLQSNVNYFSDPQTQQLLQQNLADFTTPERTVSANLYYQRGKFQLGSKLDIEDFFTGTTASRDGTAPDLSFSIAPAPIKGSKITFGLNTDFAEILRTLTLGDPTTNFGFARYELDPTISAPIGNLPFLSLNTSASWHYTYWSQSADPNDSSVQLKVPVSAQYFDLQAGFRGPTFQRIFDTPNNGYAEKFKHEFEPFATIDHYTNFGDFDRIVPSERTQEGGYTKIDYGFANRIRAKRKQASGDPVAQQIFSIEIDQSYYTLPSAAGYDASYQSSEHSRAPSNFSPIAVVAEADPTTTINGNMRLEYNWQFGAIDSISVGSNIVRPTFSTNVVYSRQFLIPDLPGFDDPTALGDSLTVSSNVKAKDNHVATTFSTTYNFTAGYFLQERITSSFNSQCCGIAFDFQIINRGEAGPRGVPYDHLFTMSFTLAGLGTFANPMGSFLK